MRVVVTEYVSLDGVMEEPAWTHPYFSDEVAAFKQEELEASDCLLLGRITYEGFAKAWPSMTDEDGFADRMNSMTKYVASRTLQSMEWNADLLEGDVVEAVRRLKAQPGRSLLVYGSGTFLETLLANELVDELRLLVFPVVLGKGKRLFADGAEYALTLTKTRSFDSGVVLLQYEQTGAQ